MSKTIKANIPARTLGKRTIAARVDTFTQDDTGRWSSSDAGPMLESEVIDICRRATNWTAIKTANFAMLDFTV